MICAFLELTGGKHRPTAKYDKSTIKPHMSRVQRDRGCFLTTCNHAREPCTCYTSRTGEALAADWPVVQPSYSPQSPVDEAGERDSHALCRLAAILLGSGHSGSGSVRTRSARLTSDARQPLQSSPRLESCE